MKKFILVSFLFLFTATLFTPDVRGQIPQGFTQKVNFKNSVYATNNSGTLSTAYFFLNRATQRVGVGTVNPLAKLHVNGTFYDSTRVANFERIINSGVSNRFNMQQCFYTLDLTDTTAYGLFNDDNSKTSILSCQKLGPSDPTIPAHSFYANPNMARMGKETDNTFRFGVVVGNNYTLVRGYADPIAFTVTDSLYNEIITAKNNHTVGIGNTNPGYPLEVTGTVGATHFISTQNVGVVSNTAGAGAGTGPTITVTGNDHAGSIQVATGTTPTAGAQLLRVTFAASFPGGFVSVILSPSNAGTAALSGATSVYAQGTGTYFDVFAGTAALTASTTYAWNYIVLR